MTFDGVPWAVGGGATIPVEALRLNTFVAASGAEGVVSPGDLRITATPTPSGSVRWAPGAAVILNRSAGGNQQAYGVRNPVGSTEILTPIAPTGSGAGRSDLVVVRVEDPQYAPWQAYTDSGEIANGPYAFPRVISNVPASTRYAWQLGGEYASHSMLAVARIDIPASTATITNAMITNLAELAQPRQRRDPRVSGEGPVGENLSATSFARWITPAQWDVLVPEWATHVNVRADVLNAIHMVGNVYGTVGVFMSDSVAASAPYAVDWTGASTRASIMAVNQFPIVTSWRGTVRRFDLRAFRAITTGYLTTDAQTRVALDLEFIERYA